MAGLYEDGFVVRVPSWHKLENVIFDDYPGREEAFLAAGHDFDVVETAAGDEGGVVDPNTFTGPMARVNVIGENGKTTGEWEWRSYRRSAKEKGLRISQLRDGAPGPMHGKSIKLVNKTYEPIQNTVPWDILDAILTDPQINGTLKLKYETGGVLEGGASCFVTAYLDTPFMIDGDNSEVYPYLFGTWRHDGMGALNFGGTDVRIVCANTRGMAESQASKTGLMISLKHTKNVLERVEDVKMALKGIAIEHDAFRELAEELGKIEFTPEQRKTLIERFVPYPTSALSEDLQVSERVVNNIEKARAAVLGALNSPTTADAHRYTGWGAYNAMTEYLDHLRPGRGGSDPSTNVTSYVKRTLLNRNTAKDVLVPLIKEVAGVA